MPRVSKNRPDVPKWARAIALRRVELGRTQTQLAEDGGQDDQGRDYLTQSNVADAETGRVHLLNMGYGRVLALARALGWTLAELQLATGLDLGTGGNLVPVGDQTARVYPLLGAGSPTTEPLPGVEIVRGVHPPRFRIYRVDVPDMDASTPTAIRPGEHAYVNLDQVQPVEGDVYLVLASDRPRLRRWGTTPFGHAWIADNRNLDPIPPGIPVLGRVYRVTSDRSTSSHKN